MIYRLINPRDVGFLFSDQVSTLRDYLEQWTEETAMK